MSDVQLKVRILPKYLEEMKRLIAEHGFKEEDFELPEFNKVIAFQPINGIPRLNINYKPQDAFYIRFSQLGDRTVGGISNTLTEIHYEFYPCLHHTNPQASTAHTYEDLLKEFKHWLRALKQNVKIPDAGINEAFKMGITESVNIQLIKTEHIVISDTEKENIKLNTIIEILKKAQVPIPFDKLLEQIKELPIYKPVQEPAPEHYYSNILLSCNYVLENDGIIKLESEGKRDPHGWIRLLKPNHVYGHDVKIKVQPVVDVKQEGSLLKVIKYDNLVIQQQIKKPFWKRNVQLKSYQRLNIVLKALSKLPDGADYERLQKEVKELSLGEIKICLEHFLSDDYITRQDTGEVVIYDEYSASHLYVYKIKMKGIQFLEKGGYKGKEPVMEWKLWKAIGAIIVSLGGLVGILQWIFDIFGLKK